MVDFVKNIDLTDELLLHIDGESTRYHTIPWDVLRNVGDKLQQLIISIAKHSLGEENAGDSENFKLEFKGFYGGSATPAFRLNNNPVPNLFANQDQVNDRVNTEFSVVMSYIDKGNFDGIAARYDDFKASNEVVSKIYEFTNSAGSAPVEIVKRDASGRFKKIYEIKKLSKEGYDSLIIPATKTYLADIQPIRAVGKILLEQKGKKLSKKITEFYTENDAILSLKVPEILFGTRKYELKSPILFQIYQEGKGYVIENEQYDLYAAARTMHQAKADLFEQFDYSYQWFLQTPNERLSDRLIAVKDSYKFIVKRIIE